MGYPAIEEEQKIIHQGKASKKALQAVISKEDVVSLSKLADLVYIDPSVERYIVEIVAATRTNANVVLGASPRGSIALAGAGKVIALMRGRGHVLPDDIKYLAKAVLAHRISLTNEAKLKHVSTAQVIDEILDGIIVPA